MPLDKGRAIEALTQLGDELHLTAPQAALGVVQVANAHMERALRVISVERGHDPRDFTLLSFGGAGGLHAADLARGLGIPRALVPPLASTLSAFGMLAADVVKDYTRTVMLPGDTPLSTLEGLFAPLTARGQHEVETEGVAAEHIHVERFIDTRYHGQSYELMVPFTEKLALDFHDLHKSTYGYSREDAPIVFVNLRVRAVGHTDPPELRAQPLEGESAEAAWIDTHPVLFEQGEHATPFYRAEALRPGNVIAGPAVVVRADTTVLLGPTDSARVDGFSNLWIEVGP
jgi:N-methylhydantoinase A